MLRNLGLTKRAPNRFNRWGWFKLVRAVGVCPRGDQLYWSADTREKPLSSRKTSVACHSRHFFYPWPDPTFPVRDRFIVSLDRQSLHFLTTPTHARHQAPNTALLVSYSEQAPEDMPNAIQRPIIFAVAMRLRTAPKSSFQLLDLRFRQVGRSTGRPFTFLLRRLLRPAPAADTLGIDSCWCGNGFYRDAAFQQLQRFFTTSLQLFTCAVWSHTPIMTLDRLREHYFVKVQ